MGMIMTIINGALANAYKCLSYTSPAWPIGAFAFSNGLEWAIEDGLICDAASAQIYLEDMLDGGTMRSDAIAFIYCWHHGMADDADSIDQTSELFLASQTAVERRLETLAQGAAFKRIYRDVHNTDDALALVQRYDKLLNGLPDQQLPYPVASGTAFACSNIDLPMAILSYLHSILANLVSAIQRLLPLGHTDAQRTISRLETKVVTIANELAARPLGPLEDALFSSNIMADCCAMLHETQYTRLFRT